MEGYSNRLLLIFGNSWKGTGYGSESNSDVAPLAGCSSCCFVSGCVFIDCMVLAVTFSKLFGATIGRVECNARTDELVPGSITPEQPMALVVPAARSEEKKHVKVVRSDYGKGVSRRTGGFAK